MKIYNSENGRKNMRLHGYDYSRAGLYFLTIVVQNRLHLFGHVENGKMNLNDAGCMIEKWYHEIENKYPDKRCHEMVVMPNHFHCIIENMVMDWFKTMTTNEYICGVKNHNWKRYNDKLWQRNYYDHIIRNWQADIRISAYIIENSAKWKDDRFNIKK
jgi:putative transposase